MSDETVGASADWVTEHRYRAVLQVLDGVPKAQVAREFGASRQSVHAWVIRYEASGLPGLADRSRRPLTSPNELAPEMVAMICELRRTYPRWGAQRIAHELTLRGVASPPSRSSVYRILVRHGLVAAQQQNHKRKYRRWQRDAPMQLWQIDIMGGVFLADGRECKLVTGIDDHARFVVMATVVTEPSIRSVCDAFIEAMARYGVPSEVLTDNGKQFTGRYTKPYPAEVLFERICRENGITTRLTKPRSPTTTGKIERFHKTLRRELLDAAGPFPSIEAAQEAIDAWVNGYNYSRPHQSLAMATPATVFRPGARRPGSSDPGVHRPAGSRRRRSRRSAASETNSAVACRSVVCQRYSRSGMGDRIDAAGTSAATGQSAVQVHRRTGATRSHRVGQRPQHPRRARRCGDTDATFTVVRARPARPPGPRRTYCGTGAGTRRGHRGLAHHQRGHRGRSHRVPRRVCRSRWSQGAAGIILGRPTGHHAF